MPICGAFPFVYVLNLTSLESITTFRKLSIDMQAPKHNPLMVTVERKIYEIFGQSYLYFADDLPSAMFESYDSLIDQWESLPDPHFFYAYGILWWKPRFMFIQAMVFIVTTWIAWYGVLLVVQLLKYLSTNHCCLILKQSSCQLTMICLLAFMAIYCLLP